MTLLAEAAVVVGLTVQRQTSSAWLAAHADRVLGGQVYGPAVAGPLAPLAARLLAPADARVDIWRGASTTLRQGSTGSVRWRDDGQWLWGALDLDETEACGGLTALAEQAYADVFDTLAAARCPHLLRIWNYLPDINRDGGGLERYRQFNLGRQQAFLHADRPAFEGAPAACALGTRGGRFALRFLAGRSAPLAIENPRQVSAYHYPSAYGPRSPTFSRAALVDAGGGQLGMLISGTSSIVGHQTLHAGDVVAQTRETVTNLRAVIAAANERCSACFGLGDLRCVVYVRCADDLNRVRSELEAAFGAGSAAMRDAVFVEADICRGDLGVEVEAHAFAAGEVPA